MSVAQKLLSLEEVEEMTWEMTRRLGHPDEFLPAQNFLRARESIEESKVFRLLQRMPKGGLFHAHSTALRSVDELMKYLDDPDPTSASVPTTGSSSGSPRRRRRTRLSAPDGSSCEDCVVVKYKYIDEEIRDQLLLDIDESTDINAVWGLVRERVRCHFPASSNSDRFSRSTFTSRCKNCTTTESCSWKSGLPLSPLRSQWQRIFALASRRDHTGRFEALLREPSGVLGNQDDFFSVFRGKSLEQVERAIDTYHEVKAKYPDFVLGFDLIGQEDKFNPLMFYSSQLQKLGENTQFFFHAGETNWYGQDSDYNLVDAILLNTKRIGHGYALIKHPKLLEIVKRKKIAIELNPISNQVLKLVADMRNHPASYLFAEDFPVVVSSDDPSIWGAKGLSYDFYEAFVGIMSSEADLRALKKLALNSITYSGLNEAEQLRALDIFAAQWSRFVAELPDSPVCRRLQTSRA
ncbi:unnamed protein product [Trichogramma brassicae]|uniref:Adenosine deaminase domain-containing protein n=1 Tax=Trichogramma brassicae TaxID=86971 RepID=A0A6H5ITC8_9HYME|nr:unnamed protein product [Trichogramma brassicae]